MALAVGDRVEKFTGDYQLSGEVRCSFTTRAGKVRLVVEHDPGFLHIYGPQNLRLLTAAPKATETQGLREAAQAVIAAAGTTYRKRNGQIGTLEGDDGEMMVLVPSDEFEHLRATLATTPQPLPETPGLREALVSSKRILREWFGGERYARDYEYLDANFGKQARQVADWVNRAALSVTSQPLAVPDDGAGRDEVVAWTYAHEQGAKVVTLYRRDKGAFADWMETPLVPASALSAERAAHEQTRQELETYRTALIPSGETKGLLMGEFWEEIEVPNPDYEGESDDPVEEHEPELVAQRVPVQWTTIKAIMQSIRQYAERAVAASSWEDTPR